MVTRNNIKKWLLFHYGNNVHFLEHYYFSCSINEGMMFLFLGVFLPLNYAYSSIQIVVDVCTSRSMQHLCSCDASVIAPFVSACVSPLCTDTSWLRLQEWMSWCIVDFRWLSGRLVSIRFVFVRLPFAVLSSSGILSRQLFVGCLKLEFSFLVL